MRIQAFTKAELSHASHLFITQVLGPLGDWSYEYMQYHPFKRLSSTAISQIYQFKHLPSFTPFLSQCMTPFYCAH